MSRRGNAVLKAWEERAIVEREAIVITARCAWCSWSLTGDVRTARDAHAAHRAAEHPDKTVRERRKPHRPHRQFQSKKDLTDNIAGARAQGAAGWAGPE